MTDAKRVRCAYCCRADDGRTIEVVDGRMVRHLSGAGGECSGSGEDPDTLPELPPSQRPGAKPVNPQAATCGRTVCHLSTQDVGCCRYAGDEYSTGPIDYPGAKSVNSAAASVQVAEEEVCAQAPYADAKPVDLGESLGDFVQRALGIAITQPIDPPPTISETIKRAADRVAAMPYQPWTPPVVSPRDAPAMAAELAAIYGQASVDVSWEKGPEPIVRPVPQDPGPGPFPRMESIAHIVPVGGLYETNSFVFRAEVPPAPGSARAAELDRQTAERKAKARRTGARRVARAARQRARGIHPCGCDCDRSDW